MDLKRQMPIVLVAVLLAIATPAAAATIPGDVSSRRSSEQVYSQDVDLDEDDVLFAIVLDRAGFRDVTFDNIASVDIAQSVRTDASQDVDLDTDDVLLAIAFGGNLQGFSGGIADYDVSQEQASRVQRDIDLDEDEVLLGVALSRTLGGSMSLFDLADIEQRAEQTAAVRSDVDLDRTDVLLAIAAGVN